MLAEWVGGEGGLYVYSPDCVHLCAFVSAGGDGGVERFVFLLCRWSGLLVGCPNAPLSQPPNFCFVFTPSPVPKPAVPLCLFFFFVPCALCLELPLSAAIHYTVDRAAYRT